MSIFKNLEVLQTSWFSKVTGFLSCKLCQVYTKSFNFRKFTLKLWAVDFPTRCAVHYITASRRNVTFRTANHPRFSFKTAHRRSKTTVCCNACRSRLVDGRFLRNYSIVLRDIIPKTCWLAGENIPTNDSIFTKVRRIPNLQWSSRKQHPRQKTSRKNCNWWEKNVQMGRSFFLMAHAFVFHMQKRGNLELWTTKYSRTKKSASNLHVVFTLNMVHRTLYLFMFDGTLLCVVFLVQSTGLRACGLRALSKPWKCLVRANFSLSLGRKSRRNAWILNERSLALEKPPIIIQLVVSSYPTTWFIASV